jgi:hypothetical protein
LNRHRILTSVWLAVVCSATLADGPQDNVANKLRPVPPPGTEIPAAEASRLEAELASLGRMIEDLHRESKSRPALLELLPDVEIYHKAVRYALTYHEFYHPREFKIAAALLQQGKERADALRQGRSPWTTATGLVVRGYLSRIDGSVQPYGLVVPVSYQPGSGRPHRLDIWFHGRGENLTCPTVAYSGAIDRQKQAADIMSRALAEEGITLVQILGPNTGHAYHAEAKREINRRMDSILARGHDPLPRRVRFTTWTLRYNQMHWVTVDSLHEHWQRARVGAEIEEPSRVRVKTSNVDALTLSMPAGYCPLDLLQQPRVNLDDQELAAGPVLSDRSWLAHFRRDGDRWMAVPSADDGTLRKRHGLQGPIDDAFLDSFVMVAPTGKPLNEKIGVWSHAEMNHAVDHWRRQFRGDARVKKDVELTDADIAESNLARCPSCPTTRSSMSTSRFRPGRRAALPMQAFSASGGSCCMTRSSYTRN